MLHCSPLTWDKFCAADKKMTVHKAWVLLSTMAAQLKGAVSIPDRTEALVAGARSFLEQSYQQYIRSKLQERRSQVQNTYCCRCPVFQLFTIVALYSELASCWHAHNMLYFQQMHSHWHTHSMPSGKGSASPCTVIV